MQVNWTWLRFADLGVGNLHDALQLRCRVFILEQGPYLDVDGIDRQSWHLLGRGGPRAEASSGDTSRTRTTDSGRS
jgi:ElaA protein